MIQIFFLNLSTSSLGFPKDSTKKTLVFSFTASAKF